MTQVAENRDEPSRAETVLLHGAGIIAALRQAGITHVVSVPDLTTSDGLLRPLASDRTIKLIRICREEEGVGICAGLIAAGARPAMLVQYTGLLASMNGLRAVALEYRQPICLLVGLLFEDSPDDPRGSRNLGISRIMPVLESFGLNAVLIARDEHVARIAPSLDRAFERSEAVAFLIGRYPR